MRCLPSRAFWVFLFLTCSSWCNVEMNSKREIERKQEEEENRIRKLPFLFPPQFLLGDVHPRTYSHTIFVDKGNGRNWWI